MAAPRLSASSSMKASTVCLRRRHIRSGPCPARSCPPLASPVRNGLVVAVDPLIVFARPSPVVVVAIARCALELIGRDADDIASEARVVFERRPRRRIVVFAHAEESAVADHRVRHPARLL